MDVVYVVRPHDRNEELRYSLRSLMNVPHDRVVIVGHKPMWVTGVVHIPTKQSLRAGSWTKYENVRMNLRALARAEISDEFLYMNDDFFFMEPCDTVPYFHLNTLAAHQSSVRAKTPQSVYADYIGHTQEFLEARGYLSPLSFELHIPFPVQREAFADVIRETDRGEKEKPNTRLLWRSAYGAFLQIESTRISDVKKYNKNVEKAMGPFYSTSDSTWTGIARFMHSRFPHQSPYEIRRRVVQNTAPIKKRLPAVPNPVQEIVQMR